MAGPRVAVGGDLNVDCVLAVRGLPRSGAEVEAAGAAVRAGGAAGNVALWLSFLGVGAAVFARVGDDPLGEHVLRTLARAGVDVAAVQHAPGDTTGLVVSLVDPHGERTMITVPGANAGLSPAGLGAALAGAAWLHLSGYLLRRRPEVAGKALELARSRGIPVSVDLCPLFTGDDLRTLGAAGIALIFGTEGELAGFSGGGEVFVKRGARGATWRRAAEAEDIPGFPVRARDTTGAGDAFVAGVLAARLRGYPPRIQGLLGNLCGALSAAGHRPPGVPRGEAEALIARARLSRGERHALRGLLGKEAT